MNISIISSELPLRDLILADRMRNFGDPIAKKLVKAGAAPASGMFGDQLAIPLETLLFNLLEHLHDI